VLLILTGCGGGGGGSSSPTENNSNPTISVQKTISGQAIDGYISGATVCLDINSNDLCDIGEPSTTTDSNGSFSFTSSSINLGNYPIITIGGTDTATGEEFEGVLKDILEIKDDNTSLETKITPLSTMSAIVYEENKKDNSNYSIDNAKEIIAQNLGITKSQINTDPLKDKTVFTKTQTIIQTTKLLKKSIHQDDSDKTKSKQAFNHVFEQMALTLKDDDFNISKIVQKVESTIFDNSIISIDNDLEDFVEEYAQEIENKTNSVTDLETLDNLQKGLLSYTQEVETKIVANDMSTLQNTIQDIRNTTTETIIVQKGNNPPTVPNCSGIGCVDFVFSKGHWEYQLINIYDKDGDTLQFTIENKPSWASFDTSTGKISGTPTDRNSTYSDIVINVSDGVDTVQIKHIGIIVLIDNAPKIQQLDPIYVNENQTFAFDIIATDEDNDTLTYVIGGDDVAYFDVNSSTGKVTFKQAPDYESDKKTYDVKYTVIDGYKNKQYPFRDVTVHINDVEEIIHTNHVPQFTSQSTVSVNENQINAIDLDATDADGDSLTYSISGTDADNFNINSLTGVVTFKSAPNYESGKTSYSFVANVSDGINGVVSQNITIEIINLNDTAPTLLAQGNSATIDRNIILNDILTGRDDDGDELTYLLVSNVSHGTLTLESNGSFQYIPDQNYHGKDSFIYKLSDGIHFSHAGQTFGITINNVNTPPFFTSPSTVTVDENQLNGIDLNATDSDGDSLTYSINGTDANSFNINSSTGMVTFKTTPNYESGKTSYIFKAIVNDNLGGITEQNISISINDINDVPNIDTNFSNITLLEDFGTIQLDINISDEEGDELNLTIESNNTSIITIDQNWTNNLNLASYNDVTLDFNLSSIQDAYGIVKIYLIVNDGDKNTTKSFDLNITDVLDIFQSGDSWKGLTYETVTSFAYYEDLNVTINGVTKTYVAGTKRVWLDRNIGATSVCTTTHGNGCDGDWYQWGRNTDGHEKWNSSAIPIRATDVTNVGHGNFILGDSNIDYDWASNDLNGSQRINNWAKIDGSSVCPIGFRIPTVEEFFVGDINIDSDLLKIPRSGYRSYTKIGTISLYGQEAFIWLLSSQNINFVKSGHTRRYEERSSGMPIRCIKD
jgi:hypothetical protein